jgi:hypothetical protein
MKNFKSLMRILMPEEHMGISTPEQTNAHFNLMIGSTLVGELELAGGRWTFKYSAHFKHQTQYAALPDFPDKAREYTSKELWPFFISRIPGLGQPQVKKELDEKSIDENNIVSLLKHFGVRSATNPYRLIWGDSNPQGLNAV